LSNNYQRKDRKSNHKFEVVRGQDLLVRVPLPMPDVWAEMQAQVEELTGQDWLQILGAILQNEVTRRVEPPLIGRIPPRLCALGNRNLRWLSAHIAEGTRLFALAGRPTKAQFVKVYGPQGPKMTWEQRAKAGVDAKHFQAALTAKGGSPTQPRQHRSEQLPNGEGFDPHPGVRYYLTYAQNSAFCEAVC